MANNNEQFAKIYADNITSVYRYVYARLFNKADVEDLTSRTFEIAYEKFTKSEAGPIENPRAWLIQIAKNIMMNEFRKKKYTVPKAEYEEFRARDLPLDEVVVTEEQAAQIKKHFKKLDPDTREVLSLRIWEEYKFKEIAELMDINESTVKSLYYRDVKKIKTEMRKEEAKEFAIVIVGLQGLAQESIFLPEAAFAKSAIAGISLEVAKMANKLLVDTAVGVAGKTVTLFGKLFTLKQVIMGAVVTTAAVSAVGVGGIVYVNEQRHEQKADDVARGRDYIRVGDDSDGNDDEDDPQVEDSQVETPSVEDESCFETCEAMELYQAAVDATEDVGHYKVEYNLIPVAAGHAMGTAYFDGSDKSRYEKTTDLGEEENIYIGTTEYSRFVVPFEGYWTEWEISPDSVPTTIARFYSVSGLSSYVTTSTAVSQSIEDRGAEKVRAFVVSGPRFH